ncbi:MAG: serine hydrolase [Gammaproteobacteria bacterium]
MKKNRTLMRKTWITAILVLMFTASGFVAAQTPVGNASRPAADSALPRLEREIARLAKGAGGVVGVSAVHLETNRRVSLNGSERFPMASVFKVPIAVQLLTRVDKGEVQLDQMIQLQASDLHPGSGTLADLFNQPGMALSVRNLLELMLLISDNSATDVCLRLAGGPEAVTARMRAAGLGGIDVNRSTALLIADWVGVTGLPRDGEWSPALFRQRSAAVTPEERKAAGARFDADLRDTATPDAMGALLERIYRKDLFKPASAELLIDIMRRCRTGEARIKGMLPLDTEVANKTGRLAARQTMSASSHFPIMPVT